MLFYHHLNSTFCLGVFSLFFIFHTIFYLSFFINIQIFVLLGRDGIPSASFCKKRYGLYIILSKQLHMIFLNNCSVNFRIKFLCNHCTILSLGKRKLVSSPTLHFFLSLAIFYKLQYKSSIPLLYAIAVNILYSVQNPIEKYVYAVLVHRSSICSSTACFVCVQTCFMGISLSSA